MSLSLVATMCVICSHLLLKISKGNLDAKATN